MKLVFAGTPEFAAHHLSALKDAGADLLSIWTQPDRRGKRGRKLVASPVKRTAMELDLPIYQPEKIDRQSIDLLGQLQPDFMIVVAYGQLLPATLLDIPRFGCINVHASLLPRWRGAAPVQRAIGAGDQETAITIMQMDKGLDTGDILNTQTCLIRPDDTAGNLLDRLQELGPALLINTLESILSHGLEPKPQSTEGICYARKIRKQEAELDWNLSAEELDRSIRMLNPTPVAFTHMQDIRVRIWSANVCNPSDSRSGSGAPGEITEFNSERLVVCCGTGRLQIENLQIPLGKGRILQSRDLYNARRNQFLPGARFGLSPTG